MLNQKLVRLRTVFAVGRHRDPADAFLLALSAHEALYVGRWGQRYRGRRWLNLASTPIRFRAEGSRAWRCFIGIGMVLSGGLSQLLVDVSTKGIAVGRHDGHAGLDVLPTVSSDGVCWTIVRFWAWPTGQGYGRGLIRVVLAAADESGATLLLQAGNRRLAEYFYAPLGFEVQAGEETAKRPWIERTPAGHQVLLAEPSGMHLQRKATFADQCDGCVDRLRACASDGSLSHARRSPEVPIRSS